jgi:hypothetical protein
MRRATLLIRRYQVSHGKPGKAVSSPRHIPPATNLRGIPGEPHALKDGPLLGVKLTLKADYRRLKDGVSVVAGRSQGVKDDYAIASHALPNAFSLLLHHAQRLIHDGGVAENLPTLSPRSQEQTQPEGSGASPVDEGHQLTDYGVHGAIPLSGQVDIHAHLPMLRPEGNDLHRNQVKQTGGEPHMGLIKEKNAIMDVEKVGIVPDLVNQVSTQNRFPMVQTAPLTQPPIDILPNEAEVSIDTPPLTERLEALEDQGITLARTRNAHEGLYHRPPRTKVTTRQRAITP